jgi:hypothetical protein
MRTDLLRAGSHERNKLLKYALPAAMALLALLQCAWGQTAPKRLTAHVLNSNFAFGRATFNAISSASDGNIYYVLSSSKLDTGGQMYRYSPSTKEIRYLGDLNQICGEQGLHAVAQGKSHVSFVEADGKLYFATHMEYYNVDGAKEIMAAPPAGYRPYPGGHFLSYDLKSGKFEDLGRIPVREGIISMTMDTQRRKLYGLTWPTGHFVAFDLRSRQMRQLEPVEGRGEAGQGAQYRPVCRALAVDPRDGSVYLTTSQGDILRYRYDSNTVATVPDVDLRKEYFGTFDPSAGGQMAYHWRQTAWYDPEGAIYAVHGNSGYLFRYLPRENRVEVLERITSEPSRRSGMFDMYYYGYLGFALGPDGRTLYYLTGGPIPGTGRPRRTGVLGVRGEENLHLITYEIPTGRYTDHGPVFAENGQRPTNVNSIAIGKDGSVYAIANISGRTDVIAIAPLRN